MITYLAGIETERKYEEVGKYRGMWYELIQVKDEGQALKCAQDRAGELGHNTPINTTLKSLERCIEVVGNSDKLEGVSNYFAEIMIYKSRVGAREVTKRFKAKNATEALEEMKHMGRVEPLREGENITQKKLYRLEEIPIS